MRRTSLIAICSGALLAAVAAPAPAAVTLGQLDPEPNSNCPLNIDAVPVTVSSGSLYRVPGNGTIISWSTNARVGPDQLLAMKVFNRVRDPDVYRVVGQDGPRPLNFGGGLHTFPTSIPVNAGDLIGITIPIDGDPPSCAFPSSPADSIRSTAGNVATGGTGNFDMVTSGVRLNVSAVLAPSNVITVGRSKRNRKKGTAEIEIDVPGPGELTVSGKGVKGTVQAGAAAPIAAAGKVRLTIRAKGKKRKQLNSKGKVKLSARLTYTPTGGDADTQSLKLKLRKTLKK